MNSSKITPVQSFQKETRWWKPTSDLPLHKNNSQLVYTWYVSLKPRLLKTIPPDRSSGTPNKVRVLHNLNQVSWIWCLVDLLGSFFLAFHTSLGNTRYIFPTLPGSPRFRRLRYKWCSTLYASILPETVTSSCAMHNNIWISPKYSIPDNRTFNWTKPKE